MVRGSWLIVHSERFAINMSNFWLFSIKIDSWGAMGTDKVYYSA